MRKESSDYYSVERLFESLFPHLSNRFEVRVVRVPYQSRGLLHCVRNLLFTARLRADVVHVTGDIYYCALAIHRRQCVLTMLDLVSLYRLQGVRKRILSLFWYSLPLRWAHFVTAISEETRKQLEREFPASKEKIEVIPCCVDDAFGCNYRSVRTDADTPRVLQVGTATNKNLERVAAAASGLPLHLRIIGPLSRGQRTLLHSLDLTWTSNEQLSAEELVREYRDSNALVFASTYEGFGLPIVEAQAIGLPVITSNIAPMTDIAGDGALFVDPYDEQEIRSALEELLGSPDLARRLSDRGRRNAKRFDAMTVADQYAGIYDRVSRPDRTRARLS
ncbi:MAG: glycosyltransferase family 4 protein [Polyangia bacterium]|jgi:glycosyltransferase involved in cell wall biosynthesis